MKTVTASFEVESVSYFDGYQYIKLIPESKEEAAPIGNVIFKIKNNNVKGHFGPGQKHFVQVSIAATGEPEQDMPWGDHDQENKDNVVYQV